MIRNLLIPALLLTSLLSGCASANDPQPNSGGTSSTTAQSVTVSVSEAGAPSYNLNDAQITSYNYQTGASRLSITGKLNNGKLLTLNFSRTGSATAYTTNQLEGLLDNVAATSATGTTTYSTQTRTVDGNYQATFASGVLSGSFAGVQLK